MADANTGAAGLIRIDVSESGQNVAANTSVVNYAFYLIERVTSNQTWNGGGVSASVTWPTVALLWSGTFGFDWRPGGLQTKLIASGSFTVTHAADGSGYVVVQGDIGSTGTQGAGGPSSVSQGITLTKLTSPPAAPTGLAATRISDSSTSLAWATHATGRAPYTSQEVYRSENGSGWIDTAALSGSASSYTTAAVANRKYTFLIQSRNSAGQTNSVASNVILTTPAKLASLVGAKVSGGIKLTFSKLDVPYTEAQVILEITTNGGTSWSAVHTFAATDLSTATTTDWTDTSAPTGGTVQYRATVKTNGGTQGVLSATATLSNAMVLNVPPSAPTNLTPSGLVDVVRPVNLTWGHTPSVDGAAQSSRQIQYSTDSGATQTDIVVGNSTLQTYAWTVNTASFTPGDTILWRVQTAGSQPGTYGAYSAWQTLTLRNSLTVSVTSPSGTWEGGDIPVEWTDTESWGSASQVAYRIVMTSGPNTVYDSGTVTSASAAGVIPAAAQQNLTSYTITVTVTDNYGLTSLPATALVDTDFLQPGPVDLQWSYDDNLGQIVLMPMFSVETSSALDDTTSWMLERSIDRITWATLGVYAGEYVVSDPLCRIGADSWYRTTGYTVLGVAGEQTINQIFAENVKSKWGRLSYGDGITARFGWSQTIEIGSGRASDAYDIEGSEYPAAVFGRQKSRKYSVTGKLLYTSSPQAGGISSSLTTASDEDMTVMQETAGVCLFRDGRGAWWNCRITDMKVTPKGPTLPGRPDEAAVSFTIERVTA